MTSSALRRGLLTVVTLTAVACAREDLDTQTFEVKYMAPHQVEQLITPYVYGEREGNPGRLSVAEGAVTVRETPDNLEKIGRVLAEYDQPRPNVMLHFQIIEANGAAATEPAIAEVEAELRSLFRFRGYRLVAETRAGGIAGTEIRQLVGERFLIEGHIAEVRRASGTVTVAVELQGMNIGPILNTTVTIPAGHSVVLGTSQVPGSENALILVLRADVTQPGSSAEAPAT